jgi:hypothetical protein
MKCGRCKGHMLEEELVVIGGPVRIKDATAWHCLQCGRVEYRSTVGSRKLMQLGRSGRSTTARIEANSGLAL